MTVPVIIIGAGGHARVLISSLKALRREIIGILHPDVTLIGQTIVEVSPDLSCGCEVEREGIAD